jgi:hypothetical protein
VQGGSEKFFYFINKTSIIVFPKMGQIKVIESKTGEEVDIYECFRKK